MSGLQEDRNDRIALQGLTLENGSECAEYFRSDDFEVCPVVSSYELSGEEIMKWEENDYGVEFEASSGSESFGWTEDGRSEAWGTFESDSWGAAMGDRFVFPKLGGVGVWP